MIKSLFNKASLAFLMLAFLASCQSAIEPKPYKPQVDLSAQEKLNKIKNFKFSSRESQIRHGNKLALDIIEKYEREGKKLNEEVSKVQYERLIKIFKRLHKISYINGESWNIVMLPDKQANAYTTFGTVIFINYGLVQALKFDDEIASILANKLASITVKNNYPATIEGQNAIDKLAILYTSLAGYDPNSYLRVWQKIFRKYGENNELFENQNINSRKFNQIELLVQKSKKYLIPGKINPNYNYILKNNSIYQNYSNSNETYNPKPPYNNADYNIYESEYLENTNKEEAKDANQLNSNQLNVSELKEIESKMQVKGADKKPNGDIVLNIKYAGTKPISNLAIKAVTEKGQSVYRYGSIIAPNQVFDANFSSDALGMGGGSRPKMKLVVDEANYLN